MKGEEEHYVRMDAICFTLSLSAARICSYDSCRWLCVKCSDWYKWLERWIIYAGLSLSLFLSCPCFLFTRPVGRRHLFLGSSGLLLGFTFIASIPCAWCELQKSTWRERERERGLKQLCNIWYSFFSSFSSLPQKVQLHLCTEAPVTTMFYLTRTFFFASFWESFFPHHFYPYLCCSSYWAISPPAFTVIIAKMWA